MQPETSFGCLEEGNVLTEALEQTTDSPSLSLPICLGESS